MHINRTIHLPSFAPFTNAPPIVLLPPSKPHSNIQKNFQRLDVPSNVCVDANARAYVPRSLQTLASATNEPLLSTNDHQEVSSHEGQPSDYFAADKRPIILYDGVCNLCNGAVNIMLDLDPDGSKFRMAALQSPAGRTLLKRCGRSPDDISSIVLVESGHKHYIRSEAILKIASGLSNPFPILAFFGFPVPPFIRDAMYDQVANNRYSFFGRSSTCQLSNAGQEHRFIVE